MQQKKEEDILLLHTRYLFIFSSALEIVSRVKI